MSPSKPDYPSMGEAMNSHGFLRTGLLTLLFAGSAVAGDTSVIDGDGFRIGDERIRFWGIDAPELGQQCKREDARYACGQEARDALSELLRRGEISCEALYEDCYGRTIARCAVNGMDLGAAMVRQGWALDFERYSDGAYADDEAEARQAKRGLWLENSSFRRTGEGRTSHKARHSFCHKPATSRNGPERTMADFCWLQRMPFLWQKRPRRANFFS